MTSIEKLLSIASEPLASKPMSMPELFRAYALGPELFLMLEGENGFYAFESALHVLPLTDDQDTGLLGWNGGSLWRSEYQDLAEGLLFFAEDILQDQFCLSSKSAGVFRFHAETGQTVHFADSVETWAARILSDYRRETGYPFAEQWQTKNGPLPRGKRLMPKKPFFLGGEYSIENMWAGNALDGMRLKGELAMQTRHLPEGSNVQLKIGSKPE